jgi:hypothetical protein
VSIFALQFLHRASSKMRRNVTAGSNRFLSEFKRHTRCPSFTTEKWDSGSGIRIVPNFSFVNLKHRFLIWRSGR